MKISCLYHQLTNQKSKQKNASMATCRSDKREKGKSFLQSTKQNYFVKQQNGDNMFNDYTIYPEKERMKTVKLNLKRQNQKQYPVNLKTYVSKGQRFQQTLDQVHFIHDQKSIRSTKSLKNNKQKLNFTSDFNQGRNHHISKKQFKDSTVVSLENQIIEITKKLQVCQLQTKKNHFEFMLLRDIVQKMKIQNLELVSRLKVCDQFMKVNKAMFDECLRINEQMMNKETFKRCNFPVTDQQNMTYCNSQNQNDSMKVSISLEQEAQFFQLKYSQQEFQQKKQSAKKQNQLFKQQKNNNIINENKAPKLSKQKNNNFKTTQKNSPLKQKAKQKNDKKYPEPYSPKVISQYKSTAKPNKSKKILHFENVLKTDKINKQDNANYEDKIDKLFEIQHFKQIQNNSSINKSQENLLESMEIIKINSRSKLLAKAQQKVDHFLQRN